MSQQLRPAISRNSSDHSLDNETVFSGLTGISGSSGSVFQLQMPKPNPGILPASDPASPYHVPFPSDPKPTEELAKRFAVWKKIIKQLIFYFREVSLLRKHYYELNVQMLKNVQFLNKQNNSQAAAKNKGSASSLNVYNLINNASSPNVHGTTDAPSPQPTDQLLGSSEEKFIQHAFLPPGDSSVQGIPNVLYNYHKALADKELVTYNKLTLKIIPRLENLKSALNVKIKEILGLKSDFKITRLKNEVAITGQMLNDYVSAVELLQTGKTVTSLGTTKYLKDEPKALSPKNDPYILRLKLDLQLKRQLLEENMFRDSFYNVEYAGWQLENIVYKEVQNSVQMFCDLINSEVEAVKVNLIDDLQQGFLRCDPSVDWDYFISKGDKNFLRLMSEQLQKSEKPPLRKLSQVQYPYQKKLVSRSIRSGYLDKKSKVLRSYNRAFYVLTLNFLHEFKTNDRKKEPNPVSSIFLSDCTVQEWDGRKLVLRVNAKDANNDETKSKLSLKSSDLIELHRWYTDLSELCSMKNVIDRNTLMESKYESSIYTTQDRTQDNSTLTSASETHIGPYSHPHFSLSGSSIHLPSFQHAKGHAHTHSSSSIKLADEINKARYRSNNNSPTNSPPIKTPPTRTPGGSDSSGSLMPGSNLRTVDVSYPSSPEQNSDADYFTLAPRPISEQPSRAHTPEVVVSEASPPKESGNSSTNTPWNLSRPESPNFTQKRGAFSPTLRTPQQSASNSPPDLAQQQQRIISQQQQFQQQQQQQIRKLQSQLQQQQRQQTRTTLNTQETSLSARKNIPQYRINLPAQNNLNEMLSAHASQPIQTPGNLPETSVCDMIAGFDGVTIGDQSVPKTDSNTSSPL